MLRGRSLHSVRRPSPVASIVIGIPSQPGQSRSTSFWIGREETIRPVEHVAESGRGKQDRSTYNVTGVSWLEATKSLLTTSSCHLVVESEVCCTKWGVQLISFNVTALKETAPPSSDEVPQTLETHSLPQVGGCCYRLPTHLHTYTPTHPHTHTPTNIPTRVPRAISNL